MFHLLTYLALRPSGDLMRIRNLFSASEAKTTIAIQWNVQKLDSAQVAKEEFQAAFHVVVSADKGLQ